MEEDKSKEQSEEDVIEEVVDQPVEEQVEDEEQVEEEVQETETQVEDVEQEEKPPSRRESLRIQKLIEKLKNPQQQGTPQFQHQGLNYGEALEADPETVKQLEADRNAYAAQAHQQGLAQAQSIQFHTRLEIDAPKVVAKYSQLNPEDKEHFNPALADAVNTWYLTTTGYNPDTGSVANSDVRYSDFVDSIFELGNEIAGQKVQTTAKNIARQAATTGIRPDGSSSKRLNLNQPVENMSDEELDAYGKQLGLATVKHR